MGFFSRLTKAFQGVIQNVRDYFFEAEEGEAEVFDEEIDLSQSPAEILAEFEELETVTDEIEQINSDLETGLISDASEIEDVTEIRDIYSIEQEQISALWELYQEETNQGFWPNWVEASDIEHIKEEYQVYSYDDLSDLDKDFLLPGWRAFESADEPAAEMDLSEMEQFRDEAREALSIPDDLKIGDEDLLTLSLISEDETFSLTKDFLDDLEPEDLAEELELEFRGTFEDLESLLNSKLWEFIRERPDLFILDFDDDSLEVDVYERKNTP